MKTHSKNHRVHTFTDTLTMVPGQGGAHTRVVECWIPQQFQLRPVVSATIFSSDLHEPPIPADMHLYSGGSGMVIWSIEIVKHDTRTQILIHAQNPNGKETSSIFHCDLIVIGEEA